MVDPDLGTTVRRQERIEPKQERNETPKLSLMRPLSVKSGTDPLYWGRFSQGHRHRQLAGDTLTLEGHKVAA
jgi:hypothetical protein